MQHAFSILKGFSLLSNTSGASTSNSRLIAGDVLWAELSYTALDSFVHNSLQLLNLFFWLASAGVGLHKCNLSNSFCPW